MILRLTTDLWISAYRKRLSLQNIPAFIIAKGDATAGGVVVKVNTLDGFACAYHHMYDQEFNRIWAILSQDTDVNVDKIISQELKFDPDLWVIEIESRNGINLLDEDGLKR